MKRLAYLAVAASIIACKSGTTPTANLTDPFGTYSLSRWGVFDVPASVAGENCSGGSFDQASSISAGTAQVTQSSVTATVSGTFRCVSTAPGGGVTEVNQLTLTFAHDGTRNASGELVARTTSGGSDALGLCAVSGNGFPVGFTGKEGAFSCFSGKGYVWQR